MTDMHAQLCTMLVLGLLVHARCDCRLGLLKPAVGASWSVTEKQEVFSIVPQIVAPRDQTTRSKSAPRTSEGLIIAEVRPALLPAKEARICLRSVVPIAAACAAGKQSPAADEPQPTDPSAIMFNVTEGTPLGPCMELSADGLSAARTVERPRPPECWPGSGYCSDRYSTWKLFTNKTRDGQLHVTLRVTRTLSTYQDTDGSMYTWSADLPMTVQSGCALKVAATAASDDTALCTGCAGKSVVLSSTSTSSSCMRCPMRSSKSQAAVAAAGSGPGWRCIPNMPKGFETIAVRMGAGGHPECASADGKRCLRNLPNAATCKAMVAVLNGGDSTSSTSDNTSSRRGSSVALQPLACGAAHAAKWSGVTGYDTPGHWCLVAREWFHELQPVVLGACVSKP